MKDFFVYCLKCLTMVICSAFGNTPDDLNLKKGVIGVITLIFISALILLLFFIFALIIRKIRNA